MIDEPQRDALAPGRIWVGTNEKRKYDYYVVRLVGKSNVIYTMGSDRCDLTGLGHDYKANDELCTSICDFVQEREPTNLMLV